MFGLRRRSCGKVSASAGPLCRGVCLAAVCLAVGCSMIAGPRLGGGMGSVTPRLEMRDLDECQSPGLQRWARSEVSRWHWPLMYIQEQVLIFEILRRHKLPAL